jgi:hypothetical protein
MAGEGIPIATFDSRPFRTPRRHQGTETAMTEPANYLLRLSRSIIQAVKDAALRAEDVLRECARRGDWATAARILDRSGTPPPRPGGEMD